MEDAGLSFRKDLKQLAIGNPDVEHLIKELEDGLQGEKVATEDSVEFSEGEIATYGIFFPFVAYFLFRWAKDWFDHKRAVNETSIAERRVALINSLVEGGWPVSVAEAVVSSCFNNIAQRTKDDPVLAQVLETARKYLPAPKKDVESQIESGDPSH